MLKGTGVHFQNRARKKNAPKVAKFLLGRTLAFLWLFTFVCYYIHSVTLLHAFLNADI